MSNTFETALREALTDLDIDLPHELWALISWLEERGQRFETPAGLPFLAIADAIRREDLWSHIYFDLPPDLVRFWFGQDGLEKQVIPFVHCGGDGSYIALWRHAGAPDRYVFLGSEGEAFTLAETPLDFITLLTMGYPWIEMRQDLTASPEQMWESTNDDPWPDLAPIKAWVTKHFGIQHPMTGSTILPYAMGDDPFASFVAGVTAT
ncbi:MAG: hypothetical protein ACU0GG_13490 [Paracoccaceae bacterium]